MPEVKGAETASAGAQQQQPQQPGKPAVPPALPRPSLQKRNYGPDEEPRSNLPVVHALRLRSAGKASKQQKIASFRTSLAEGIDLNNWAQPIWFRRKSAFVKAQKEREEAEENVKKLQEGETAELKADNGDATGGDTARNDGPQLTVAPYGNTAPKDKTNLFKKKWRVSYRHKPDPEKVEFDKEQKDPFMAQSAEETQKWKADYIHLARMNTLLFFTDDGFKVFPNAKRYNFLRQAPAGWTEEKAREAEEQRKDYEAALDRKMRQVLSRKDAEKMTLDDMKMTPKERAFWANKNRPGATVATVAATHRVLQKQQTVEEREDEVDALDFEEVFEDDEEGDPFPEMLDEDAKADRQREKRQYMADRFDDDEDMDRGRSKLNKEGKRLRRILRKTEENDAYASEDSEKDPLLSEDSGSDLEFLEFDGLEKVDGKDGKNLEGDKDRPKSNGSDTAQPGGTKKAKSTSRSGKISSKPSEKQPPPNGKIAALSAGLKKKREESPAISNKKQKVARGSSPAPLASAMRPRSSSTTAAAPAAAASSSGRPANGAKRRSAEQISRPATSSRPTSPVSVQLSSSSEALAALRSGKSTSPPPVSRPDQKRKRQEDDYTSRKTRTMPGSKPVDRETPSQQITPLNPAVVEQELIDLLASGQNIGTREIILMYKNQLKNADNRLMVVGLIKTLTESENGNLVLKQEYKHRVRQ